MNRTNWLTLYTPIGYVMLMYELKPLKRLWSYGLKIVIPHNSGPDGPRGHEQPAKAHTRLR